MEDLIQYSFLLVISLYPLLFGYKWINYCNLIISSGTSLILNNIITSSYTISNYKNELNEFRLLPFDFNDLYTMYKWICFVIIGILGFKSTTFAHFVISGAMSSGMLYNILLAINRYIKPINIDRDLIIVISSIFFSVMGALYIKLRPLNYKLITTSISSMLITYSGEKIYLHIFNESYAYEINYMLYAIFFITGFCFQRKINKTYPVEVENEYFTELGDIATFGI